LPEDYLPTVKDTLKALGETDAFASFARQILKQGWVKPNKRIFDNTKISDHFAIIPTLQAPKQLNEAEQKIYDMVVRRFLAVFYPAAEFLQTTRITRVGEHRFHPQPLATVEVEQLVVDAEARLGREVVHAVDAREEPVLLPRRVAQPTEHVQDPLRVDDQAALAVLVIGAEDRSLGRPVQLLRDQLEPGRVGHQERLPRVATERVAS